MNSRKKQSTVFNKVMIFVSLEGRNAVIRHHSRVFTTGGESRGSDLEKEMVNGRSTDCIPAFWAGVFYELVGVRIKQQVERRKLSRKGLWDQKARWA